MEHLPENKTVDFQSLTFCHYHSNQYNWITSFKFVLDWESSLCNFTWNWRNLYKMLMSNTNCLSESQCHDFTDVWTVIQSLTEWNTDSLGCHCHGTMMSSSHLGVIEGQLFIWITTLLSIFHRHHWCLMVIDISMLQWKHGRSRLCVKCNGNLLMMSEFKIC